MTRTIFFTMVCLIFLNMDLCYGSSSCFPDRDKICKENVKQMSQEYDDFLAFFYGERNWRVPLDFLELPVKLIKRDGSKNDPLSDEFYK